MAPIAMTQPGGASPRATSLPYTLIAYVFRKAEGTPILNRLFEARPLNSDGSELELLYKFVNGFGQRIPAQLMAEFAAPAP